MEYDKKRNGKIVTIYKRDFNITANMVVFKELKQNYNSYDDKIIFTDSNLEQGDIVEFVKDKYIVISDKENVNNIYYRYIIRKLYKTIKIWIDDKLEEFDAFVETGNNITQEDKYINLPVGTIKLIMQENEKTDKIDYDKRFITMNNAYKVVGFTSEYAGLKYIYAEKTQFSAEDDKENEIADATKHIHTYKLNIINKSPLLITMGDDPVTLQVECTDNDKKVEKPTLIYSIDKEGIIKVADNKITPLKNGSCKLTIKFENVKKSIDVNVIEQQVDNKTIEIEGKSKIGWGKKGIYTVILKNNDKVYKDRIEFQLVEKKTGKATKLAKIIEQDVEAGTCTIQANDKQNDGTVILKVKTSIGETQEKEIEICSFWLVGR
ncbi:hypothetical protein Z968_11285 [Clostridium novyi A str. 4552]|uniref:Uncharacterized protein n=1 Tax=Clostridium novyi A str. 4552 TaxID=1444289 RepID=A0A0A0I4L3_CLONO|nr:hypothetical protein [Clostridium novyi]KGM94640.1 hypothetical protein Z968_11285 [Clostridium novyi A str. 4552]